MKEELKINEAGENPASSAPDLVDSDYVKHVKIKKPIELDGKEINVVTLDFSNLTGQDMLNIDRELRLERGTGFENVWDMEAMAKLAARASNIIEYDLRKLHAIDFTEVTLTARAFYLEW